MPPDTKPPFRLTRRNRRILLVLLSGASNLGGFMIMRQARVGSGTLYPLLARMEARHWVEFEVDGQRAAPVTSRGRRAGLYRLTPAGRAQVMGLLGLEEAGDR